MTGRKIAAFIAVGVLLAFNSLTAKTLHITKDIQDADSYTFGREDVALFEIK